MPGDNLPEAVHRFLENNIDSVEQLRVLLLLRSDPARHWTVDEITAEMRSSANSIQNRLEGLYSRKVLVRSLSSKEHHTYSPASDQLREMITLVAEIDKTRPYRVIDAIYSGPTKTLMEFANAFKIRGNKS